LVFASILFVSADTCIGDPTVNCADYRINYFGWCELDAPAVCGDCPSCGDECEYYDDWEICGDCWLLDDCEDLNVNTCPTVAGCSWQAAAPVASFTATPTSGLAPLAIDFDGSASQDSSSGYIVSYEWDFGDGETQSGVMVTSHTYDEVGSFSASLTVTDNQGGYHTVYMDINSLGPPGVCYGDATIDCDNTFGTPYGCSTDDMPAVCAEVDCQMEDYYDGDQIEVCQCVNALDCEDLSVAQCSTVDGCSYGSCGDGVYEPGEEECDDGCAAGDPVVCELDIDDGDGCSSSCEIEPGWTCTGDLSVCEGALIVDLDFQVASGNNVLDNSDFENNFTKQAVTSCGEIGIDGVACSFDNSPGDYLEITSLEHLLENSLGSSTRQLTVSAWVKPTAYPTGLGRMIVGNWYAVGSGDDIRRRGWLLGDPWGSADHLGFCVQSELGGSVVCAYDNGFFAENINQWTHVVGVFKGGDYLKVYVNGVETGTNSNVPYAIANKADTPLRIGHSAYNEGRGMWDGLIDEVKIYTYALPVADVSTLSALYGSEAGGGCTETDDGTVFIAGTVTINEVDYPDECTNDNTGVSETSCAEGGALQTNEYDCPEGSTCSDGACALAGGGSAADLSCPANTPAAGLSEAPARSRQNSNADVLYYCDYASRAWVQAGDIGDDCLEDYQCISNACLDGECLSIGAELEAQRGILQQIYCFIVSIFTAQTQDECLAAGGVGGYIEGGEPPADCSETDNGFDPTIAGTCTDSEGTQSDSCAANGMVLTEYYCGGTNECFSDQIPCMEIQEDSVCDANACTMGVSA